MPISVGGLASGLDSARIIAQLMAIARRPVTLLQTQVSNLQLQQTAIGTLNSNLVGLKGLSTALSTLSTFRNRLVSSSNESVLTASATSSASLGAFTFRVGRTATASQAISKGFADAGTTAVGAGTFTVEFGTRNTSAHLDPKTSLSFLNGQSGVSRGSIKITDRAGDSAVIDLSTAETVQDVIDAINSNETARVTASVSGDVLVITDDTGSTSSNLKVEEVGGKNVARDLGILQSVASSTLTGTDVNTLATTSKLDILNNGLGVRNAGGTDFTISVDGGAAFNVALASTDDTIAEVVAAIENAATLAGEDLTVSLTSNRKALQIVDNAGDGGSITITDVSGAAEDLFGPTLTASGDTFTGARLVSELNTILTRLIQGGSGLSTTASGTTDLRVTLSNGNTFDVDLDSSMTSLQNVLDAIKAAHDAAYPATASSFLVEMNGAGNGLRLKDSYGGSGNIAVAALNGSSAASNLGILKTGTAGTLEGDDIDRKFVSEAMLLANLNGGKGIFRGTFQVTDREGKIFSVDIGDTATITTVADLINEFNSTATAAGSSATLALNSAGDGVILTSSAGSGTLVVSDQNGGSTAKDLNLATTGTTSSTVNGSYELSVTVSAAATLNDVVTQINGLGRDVVASVINDGSPSNPYRLSITAKGTGEAGSVIVDGKTSSFEFSQTIRARNAGVLVGDTSSGSTPLFVTHADNTIENVLTGLTLNIKSASSSPVTVTVSNDDDTLANELASFVGSFNAAISQIRTQSRYNAETQQTGVLLGVPSVRLVEDRLFKLLRTPVKGLAAPFDRIQPLGVSVDDETGLLVFDRATFDAALASDRTAVEKLLRAGPDITTGMSLSQLRAGEGIRQIPGNDFEITRRDGVKFKVNIDDVDSLQGVLTAINTASGNTGAAKVVATISSDGSGITLTDSSSGSGNLNVVSISGSFTAEDLGIAGTETTASGSSTTVRKGAALNVNGLMAIFNRQLDLLTRSDDGTLTDVDESIQSKVDDLEGQIESMEARLAEQELQLQKQFAALESVLAQLQAQSSFIAQQFSALASSQKGSGSGGGLNLL